MTGRDVPVDCSVKDHPNTVNCRQSLLWRLQGSTLTELAKRPTAFGGRELQFRMLEGDFQKFEVRDLCGVASPVISTSQRLT